MKYPTASKLYTYILYYNKTTPYLKMIQTFCLNSSSCITKDHLYSF